MCLKKKASELYQNCTSDFLKKFSIIIPEDDCFNYTGRHGILNINKKYIFKAGAYLNNNELDLSHINNAWVEYYDETLQSKTQITYSLYNHHHTLGQNDRDPDKRMTKDGFVHSLMMIGKIKEIIKIENNINDINYIHIYSRKGGKLLDDNKTLFKNGIIGRSTLHIELKDPQKISNEISTQPVPSPAPCPPVIHAQPLSTTRHNDIKELEEKIIELEKRMKLMESKLDT